MEENVVERSFSLENKMTSLQGVLLLTNSCHGNAEFTQQKKK